MSADALRGLSSLLKNPLATGDAPLPAARLPPAVLYSTGPNARASTGGVDQPSNADEQAAAAYQNYPYGFPTV